MALSLREHLTQRLQQLKSERHNWEANWRDIGEQMAPYRYSLFDNQTSRGKRNDSKIRNNKPVIALNTLAAGMMAGITSPARSWFKLTMSDRELADFKPVKEYLHQSQRILEKALRASEWYTALADGAYPDVGSFGTGCLMSDEGEKPGSLRFESIMLGTYFVDQDSHHRTDTVYRELRLNVRQLVKRFRNGPDGMQAFSQTVRNAWDQGNYNTEVLVVHAVEPNDEFEEGRIGPQGMRWRSCWWDVAENRQDQLLHQGGYEEFPGLVPR